MRYANPLPLGLFSFAIGMALLGGSGLGLLRSGQDLRTAGLLMAAFVFPLQLVAAIFALLARDTGAATALGLFATSWLALGLANVLAPTPLPSRPVGMFLAAFTLMLVPLAVNAAVNARLLSVVLTVSTVRAALQAGYEVGGPHWLDTASGAAALVLVMLAAGVGTFFLLPNARMIGRRSSG